ncbi:MAG: EF-hand domain-containing protein [Planctomycetota bacterium]|nr:EF-hand domain-containing protein [Planctomycetota bacterium]
MKKMNMAAAMALTLTAGVAFGQGTIVNGDARWQYASVGTSAATLGNNNFQSDGTSSLDHMFQQWFWYRASSSMREVALGDPDFPFSLGQSYVGNTAHIKSSQINVSAVPGAKFSYDLKAVVTDGASVGSAIVQLDLTIKNLSTFAVPYTFFMYADPSVGGTSTGDSVAILSGSSEAYQVTDGSNYVEVRAVGADRFQLGTQVDIRGLLNDNATNTLTNLGSPTNNNDVAGVLSWSATMAPNETKTFTSYVSINMATPVPCLADFNGDGFLDFTDFDAFVAAFEAGNASADFNADGFLDFTDFDAFVAAFEAGC